MFSLKSSSWQLGLHCIYSTYSKISFIGMGLILLGYSEDVQLIKSLVISTIFQLLFLSEIVSPILNTSTMLFFEDVLKYWANCLAVRVFPVPEFPVKITKGFARSEVMYLMEVLSFENPAQTPECSFAGTQPDPSPCGLFLR